MKGACDGGIFIPHNEKRFPGFRVEKMEEETNKRGKKKDDAGPKKKEVFTVEEHAEHIFGVHVQEYYDLIKKDDPEAFKRQFSKWEKELKGRTFEAVYKDVQAKIKKDPIKKKAALLIQQSGKGKWLRLKKIGLAARKERVQKKL